MGGSGFTYKNGQVPASRLVTFASGWLPNEGTWYHQLPPATYRKHLALVALAKKNTGRVLKISEGWGAYRPLHIQEYAKRIHGRWAATPGTSSHGMFWEGAQCAAIDYGNWGHVYNWNRDAFFRDVRAVGLVPDLISPRRGYPDEPWHVVDRSPWAAVASGSLTLEDDVSAEDVWNFTVSRATGKVRAIQELADSKSAAIAARDALAPINRGGKSVPVRQEIADAKSNTIKILAEMKALTAAVRAMATASGADPAAILAAVQTGVKDAMRGISFTTDIDG